MKRSDEYYSGNRFEVVHYVANHLLHKIIQLYLDIINYAWVEWEKCPAEMCLHITMKFH